MYQQSTQIVAAVAARTVWRPIAVLSSRREETGGEAVAVGGRRDFFYFQRGHFRVLPAL